MLRTIRNDVRGFHRQLNDILDSHFWNQEKEEEIWLNPMTKAPIPLEKANLIQISPEFAPVYWLLRHISKWKSQEWFDSDFRKSHLKTQKNTSKKFDYTTRNY